MSQSILALSYFFHLIATVIWVGGLLLMLILVWPEVRRTLEGQPSLHAVLLRLRRRFIPLTNLSLAVLVVTGMFQMTADPNYDGVLQFTNDWSRVILLKHIVIVGMVIAGAVLHFGVAPALERAALLAERGKADPAEHERLLRQERRLTWVSAALGVLVLGFSAWATAI